MARNFLRRLRGRRRASLKASRPRTGPRSGGRSEPDPEPSHEPSAAPLVTCPFVVLLVFNTVLIAMHLLAVGVPLVTEAE